MPAIVRNFFGAGRVEINSCFMKRCQSSVSVKTSNRCSCRSGDDIPIFHLAGSQPVGPRCFAPRDVQWALAWASVAPGGWSAEIVASCDGDEYFGVTPPGSSVCVFLIDPDIYGAATLWRPGQYDLVAHYPTLRDAVLALCPLEPRQLGEVDALHEAFECASAIPGWDTRPSLHPIRPRLPERSCKNGLKGYAPDD